MSFSTDIPAEDSGAQVSPSEPGKASGYVTRKIRASNPKKRGEGSRTRAWGRRLITRAAKKLDEMLKDIPDEYLDRALRRLGDQLDATKKMWDVNAKRLIEIPDEKIRQDAALAILAYKWGRPVERQINAHANATDFPALIETMKQSPTFQALQNSSQKTVEGKEIPPELPTPQV
jgi:hypothetical protein